MATEKLLGVAGGAVAIVGLPAYIGWSDRTFGTFLVYALLAGTALAVADHLTVSDYRDESAKALIQHALYRILSVAVVGGLAYGIAILAL